MLSMNFVYLTLSILGESAGTTLDKLNFAKYRISARQMMSLAFLAMSIFVALYILTTGQPVPRVSLKVAALLLGVAVFSFGGNVFDELSLKADDLSLREPLVDFEPILAGLVGYALFPAQRKPTFLIVFLLGAIIVRWGIHRRKLRSKQKQGMFYLLIGVGLYAVLPSLYQEVLRELSAPYLVLFRVASISVLTTIFFRPKSWKGISSGSVAYVIGASLMYAIGAVASMYVIQAYGIVIAMLLLMLGPALRYLAGLILLREKVRLGEVLSSLTLTALVIGAAIM